MKDLDHIRLEGRGVSFDGIYDKLSTFGTLVSVEVLVGVLTSTHVVLANCGEIGKKVLPGSEKVFGH